MKKTIIVLLITIGVIGIIGQINSFKNLKETKVQKMKIINKKEKSKFVNDNQNLQIIENKLVNQDKELILLKGISTHGIQWYGDFLNKENLKTLKEEWNSNVFRIAMYTKEGGYIEDSSIKEKVKKMIKLAIDLDLYVIVDWHILSDNNPMTYLKEAQVFFQQLSEEYRNTPNLIYEICNEPNGETTWDNDIKPYAEEIIKVIRKNSDNIIIVGTPNWSQDVDIAAKNPLQEKNIMYALHFYAGTHKEKLREKAQKALERIPIFVSEWGVGEASGNGGVFIEESQKWIDFMKENSLSWVNWSLSNKEESTALLVPNAPNNSLSDEFLSTSGKFIKEKIKEN